MPAFFEASRDHFFRPLDRQDREAFAAVLRTLYERVYGYDSDYSEVLTRHLVISIVLDCLTKAEVRAGALPNRATSEQEERDYAGGLVRDFKEFGWLEDYKDPITLKPTLKFTRAGKEFAESFSNIDNSRPKTRQRNMRSARKALASFLDAGYEADELLDAYDYSVRVVEDLQGDIDHFRGLIQSLTREALEQKIAWGEFNEFIEKRFARDVSTRLVADSAERHRGAISDLISSVRCIPEDTQAEIDTHLFERAPWLEQYVQPPSSAMLWLCQQMELKVEAACEQKLPMFRTEFRNYMRRFESLLRQAISLDYGAESPLGLAMTWLKTEEPAEHDALLDAISARIATTEVRLAPAGPRWTVKDKEADTPNEETLVVNEESRIRAAMRRAEAEAFALSETDVLRRLWGHLQDGPLSLSDLELANADDVIAALHAVGATRSSDGRKHLVATKLQARYETEFFIADDYRIEPRPDISTLKPS